MLAAGLRALTRTLFQESIASEQLFLTLAKLTVADRSHPPEYLKKRRMANEDFCTIHPHVDNLVDDHAPNMPVLGSDGGSLPLSTAFLPRKRVIHDFIHGVMHVQIG